jgi:hypothetical protein
MDAFQVRRFQKLIGGDQTCKRLPQWNCSEFLSTESLNFGAKPLIYVVGREFEVF